MTASAPRGAEPQLLLVVCRTVSALAGLHGRRFDRPLAVASDDPRVQLSARSIPGVSEVSYIEQTASFYSVAAEVRTTVGAIDEWLASFTPADPAISPEVMRWGCTVEGGMTSQRVQDALLLIDSYQSLIDRIRPAAITVMSARGTHWDDLVLAHVAGRRGIPFRQQAPSLPVRLKQAAVAYLRPCALAAYRLLHLFRLGGGRWSPRLGKIPGPDGSVLFVRCSRARNHWENISPVMRELLQQGAGCQHLCWNTMERMAPRDAASAAPGDMLPTAHQLERWVGLHDVWAALLLARRLRRRIMSARDGQAAWQEPAHRDVPLAPLLTESLRHFLIAELPFRLIFSRALRAALADSRPAAVKPWGAPEGFEYRLISRVWPAKSRPLIFQYWLGVGMAWPYADVRQPLDLFLAKDANEAAQVARDYQRDPNRIKLVGQIRLAGHRAFADDTPQAVSRRSLGLPDRPQALHVGFDPNCALRGYQSAREQAEITKALLAAAAASQNLVLVVKPHPAYPIDHLAPLFSATSTRTVVVLPRDAPLGHFLNAVDLVVSKYSTLLLEAALMRRAALAVIPDGDMRFRVFGDLTPVMQDLAALSELLVKLASTPAYRDAWIAERRRTQEDCLQRNYLPPAGLSPAARAAAAIIAHASRHHSD